MTPEQAYRRIRAQTGDAARRAAADVLLANDGDLGDLHAAVDALWHDRLVPYERNVRDRHAVRLDEVRPGPVAIVDPDPTWPAQFARLAARIRHALRPVEPCVDHIGSTAVPGLAAKDIIDIQLTVPALADADTLADRLADAGFPRCPGGWWDVARSSGGGRRWDKRLYGSADPGRPINLHVREAGSPGWRYALLMRDHLRADPQQRAAYLAVKRARAADSPDIASYAAGKDPWFDEEHVQAERWAAETGWRP
jgi:dephospho-CoA kinase